MEKEPLCASRPTAILCVGMAGSGKSTFVGALASFISSHQKSPLVFNLDPAVLNLPYVPDIDIREKIDYKDVMKKHNLGPNGAILTALNLFSMNVGEVVAEINSGADTREFVLVDTPGQIEVFTWSASGSIISSALQANGPCVLAYVIDTPRSLSPSTFMSNMLYACSIFYRFDVPFIVVFNKTDEEDCDKVFGWFEDFTKFQEAAIAEESYMTDLTQSLALILDEFYSQFPIVKVSSITGEGIPEFVNIVRQKAASQKQDGDKELDKFISDLNLSDSEK